MVVLSCICASCHLLKQSLAEQNLFVLTFAILRHQPWTGPLQHQVSFSLAPPVCTAFGHARCCFRGAGVRFERLGKASWPWRALALHSLAAAFSFPLAHSRHRQLVSLHASEVLGIAPTLERNGALEAGLASYRLPDGTLSGVGSSSCCALQSFTTAGLHASGLQDQ